MRGIDIYHGDGYPLKSIAATAYEASDFVIVKATEHSSDYKYADYFKPMIEKVLADGKLGGAYHYASGTDPFKEADYFISVVHDYIGKIILALDWEAGSNKAWKDTEWCKSFIQRVKDKTGVTCFLYANMDGIAQCKNLANKVPLWFAGYPKNENSWSIPKWPNYYSTRPWMQYEIWQFTSGGGKIDRNISNMTPADWMTYAQGQHSTTEGDTAMKNSVTAETIINIMKGWLGLNEKDGSYKTILDIYNKHEPLARGYKVTTKDSWCAVTVSAAFIKANAVDLIGGTECSVQKFIDIFKKKGIWEENGKITPKPGYIITYNWDDTTQPNDGWADHIGVVESVKDKTITVIEGNYQDSVKRRIIKVADGRIRGYAMPKYSTEKTEKPKENSSEKTRLLQLVADTMKGKYGSGNVRKQKLGLDYDKVQQVINHVATTKTSTLANEVIAGDYGTGEIRKAILGNKYETVQKAVNKLING